MEIPSTTTEREKNLNVFDFKQILTRESVLEELNLYVRFPVYFYSLDEKIDEKQNKREK